jgi:hypothetical protein
MWLVEFRDFNMAVGLCCWRPSSSSHVGPTNFTYYSSTTTNPQHIHVHSLDMPNKTKARAQQAYPPPQPSDYETDAPANMDIRPPPRSNIELNLSVIRRHYPEVTNIHYLISYAALYVYILDPQGWERTNTEGSLFLCELVPSPEGVERFSVIMLNRKGLENFTMEIKSPEDVDFGEFIMMQSDQGQVYGLWIMNDPPPSSTANAKAELQDRLQELAERAQRSREAVEETRNREQGALAYEEVDNSAHSVQMGRQLSLRELFGKPQAPSAAPTTAHMGFAPTPPAHSDVLSQLFLKAKQDYNGQG